MPFDANSVASTVAAFRLFGSPSLQFECRLASTFKQRPYYTPGWRHGRTTRRGELVGALYYT